MCKYMQTHTHTCMSQNFNFSSANSQTIFKYLKNNAFWKKLIFLGLNGMGGEGGVVNNEGEEGEGRNEWERERKWERCNLEKKREKEEIG